MQSPSSFYALDRQAGCGGRDRASATLDALHDQLDAIDARLLHALRQRLDCCSRIGLHKRKHGLSILESRRTVAAQRRVLKFAVDHGIPGGFLQAIFSLLIDEACRLEIELMKSSCDSGSS